VKEWAIDEACTRNNPSLAFDGFTAASISEVKDKLDPAHQRSWHTAMIRAGFNIGITLPFLRMRNTLFLVLLLAILLSVHASADSAILVKGQNLRVMPVGDSITLGKGSPVDGYRRILYEWLIAHGYSITYVGKQNLAFSAAYPTTCSDGSIPWHEGYGSFRIDEILNGGTREKQTAPPLATSLATFKPDIVLLMIGTNDILQKYQTDTMTDRLTQIIETIYAYNSKTTVLVASIAPLGGWTRVAQEKLAQPYNAAIPGIVAKEKVLGHAIAFVDVHQALLHKGDLSGDQVHPSPSGYACMAQAWYKALTDEEAPAIDPNNPLQLPPPLPAK
jgi:lysophospholipase L1-like esterase